MNITTLELDDITDEFVRANYDIDAERKIKRKMIEEDISIFDVNKAPIDEFLLDFKAVYNEAIDRVKIPTDFKLIKATVEPFQEWDYITLRIYCHFERAETDEEVIKKLAGSIKRDIKKYQKAENSKDELIEKLKAKYSDDNDY